MIIEDEGESVAEHEGMRALDTHTRDRMKKLSSGLHTAMLR